MESYEQRSKLTNEQIVDLINIESEGVSAPGLNFLYDELTRRSNDATARRMERLEWAVLALTVVSVVTSIIAIVEG